MTIIVVKDCEYKDDDCDGCVNIGVVDDSFQYSCENSERNMNKYAIVESYQNKNLHREGFTDGNEESQGREDMAKGCQEF